MDLIDYLKKNRMKRYELAELLDIHQAHLSHVLRGHFKASKKLLRRVELVTNGEVSAEEFLKHIQRNKENIDNK